MENLEYRTRKVVADVFGLPIDSVDMETSHDTVVNWDSVNMINLLMALENEFSIQLGVEDVTDLLSVKLIVELLREKHG